MKCFLSWKYFPEKFISGLFSSFNLMSSPETGLDIGGRSCMDAGPWTLLVLFLVKSKLKEII